MPNRSKQEQLGLFIPKDAHQSGDLHIEGVIRIDGSFSGNLFCESKLYVGITGKFEGQADVENADIAGEYKGNLRTRNRFSLTKSGRFQGLLDAEVASMEAGATFNGEVRIKGKDLP